MAHRKNVIDIERKNTANGLQEIPVGFFTLSFNKWDNDARRLWFSKSSSINWKEAACVGQQTDWWFPERGQNDILDLALSICSRCPIKTQCLAFAICTGEDEGVWGGTTARERKHNRRRLLEHLKEKRAEDRGQQWKEC